MTTNPIWRHLHLPIISHGDILDSIKITIPIHKAAYTYLN